MVHFTVYIAFRGSAIQFDVLLANIATAITQLKTGASTWQSFIIDANNGTVINLQPNSSVNAIQSFTYKYP